MKPDGIHGSRGVAGFILRGSGGLRTSLTWLAARPRAPSCCSAISGVRAEKAIASYMPNIALEPFSAALARLDPAKPPGDRKRRPLGPVHSMQGGL